VADHRGHQVAPVVRAESRGQALLGVVQSLDRDEDADLDEPQGRVGAVITLGYKASAEQFGPRELLDYALAAERNGFDSAAISDHFQPFRHTGGHAPAALPWLGALAATSSRARIGTSVLTPTLRYHPSVVAQAFATLACLAPGRVFLGVGTGESMNEVPPVGIEWPRFAERLQRLREAIELIRRLWTEDRVSFKGAHYRTHQATVYDRPAEPVPVLIAAAGPKAARFVGEVGDGFITTSGKRRELYTETLLPAVFEGARAAGRDPGELELMLEVKVSYEHDLQRAVEETRFWAALALPAEAKQGVDDPLELERLASEEHVRSESRFIVSGDAEEMADQIGSYVEMGFRHLIFHSPAPDQHRFVERFGAEVLPILRDRYAGTAASRGSTSDS
jgi:coenzyme F420-dependent glucose-6-phosphate dehydrogenase